MKMLFQGLAAAGLLSAAPALAVSVVKTVDVAAPPARVWQAIGGFCGIGQWHPAIDSCTPSARGTMPVRTLALKGGGTIVEGQVARSDAQRRYSYTILESPLPVTGYRSTIRVTPNGAGSRIRWSGTFKAKGAPDAEAAGVIGGIYDAGLAGIAAAVK